MGTKSDAIDDQLREAILRDRRRTKLERDAASLSERITELRGRVAELERVHAEETADVEALTATTIRKLLARLRGDLDEQLTAEEAEAARSATELAHARDVLATEEQRRAEVERELGDLGDPHHDVAALREAKQQQLDPDSAVGQELAHITEEAARITADVREVDEALVAGGECLSALEQAAQLLRSAGNWSTWDVFGGGMLVTMQKHAKLDDARRAGTAASTALRRFADELQDVREDVVTATSIELTEWDHAFDFWFDNVFTDMRIDSMIRRSQTETEQVDATVRELTTELRRVRTTLTDHATELQTRRETLLDPPLQ